MSEFLKNVLCPIFIWLFVGTPSQVAKAAETLFTTTATKATTATETTTTNNNTFSGSAIPPRQQQETGWVTGKITGSDDLPTSGLIVAIKNHHILVKTDSNGVFKLASPAGRQMLLISYPGKVILEKPVTIVSGTTVEIGEIRLNLASGMHIQSYSQQLNEVKITDLWRNKFSKKESPYIAKMPLKNLENPQAYTVIPKELLEEQVVTDFNAALRNAPGVAIGPRVDNGRNVFLIRGFSDSGYMRNGLSSPAYMDVDPVNLESIEVIKGPSGTLYGSSLISYGGLINRVTKKPLKYFTGSASFVAGGFNLNRITADVNTPVNKDSTLLFRLNTALTRQGSFQDYGYSKTFMLAPVISYQVNPDMQIILEAEIYNRDATALPGFTITSTKSGITNANQLNSIYKKSFSTNQLSMQGGSKAYFGQIKYRINDNWKSHSSINYSINDYYRLGVRSFILTESTLRRTGGDVDYSTEALNLQQNFTGEIQTGVIKHRLLIGVDYLQRNNFLYNNLTKGTVDTVNYKKAGTPFLSKEQIEALAGKLEKSPTNSANNTYGAYLSDVLDFRQRVFLMLSLRYDYYDNKGSTKSTTGLATGAYDQGVLSPKVGLVYQVLKDRVSVFANYMNGFVNVDGQDAEGGSFKPQQANQWEGGIKSELFGGRLNAMFSYYDIRVTNILRQNLANPDFSIQDGQRSSKGFEAEVIANLLPGLNLIVGYGYNKSRFDQSDVALQGKKPADVPDQNANFWFSYTASKGMMKGFGLGFGGNYIGSTFYNDINTITVPDAFIINSSVYLARRKYRLSLKADNLTNKYYWASLNPQMPFRLSASLQLMF